ncbi:hypothetical protein BH23GEM9_BH23GEM9_32360 [soil metagenome]
MTGFLLAAAVFMLLTVTGGLLRIVRGPTPADRMLAAQLFGTAGVAVLLVLGSALELRALRDVALVFALLAAVLTVTFVKRGWPGRNGDDGSGS